MIDPGLANYIKNQLATGISIEAISEALVKGGWSKEVVDAALAEIANSTSAPDIVTVDSVASFTGYAGFWIRVLAYLIDGVVLLGVLLVISGGQLREISVLEKAVLSVISWLYFTLLESSSKQATLGKIALGLKVTDMVGDRITWGRANGRFFSKILSGMILNIGYIMVAFTARKQGLHDLIAQTLVIRGVAHPPNIDQPSAVVANQPLLTPVRSNASKLLIVVPVLVVALILGYMLLSNPKALPKKPVLTNAELIRLDGLLNEMAVIIYKYETIPVDYASAPKVMSDFANEINPIVLAVGDRHTIQAPKTELDYVMKRYNSLVDRQKAATDRIYKAGF